MRTLRLITLLCATSLVVLSSHAAEARTLEAGTLSIAGGVGPGFRMGSDLGISKLTLAIHAMGEYMFASDMSAVGELGFGFAGTLPLRLRGGVRYRMSGGDLPIAPYVQGQLAFGRLNDVIGANLSYFGVRAAAGADYGLTANLSVGGQVGLELATTMGERPARFSYLDVFAVATYIFGGSGTSSPAAEAPPADATPAE